MWEGGQQVRREPALHATRRVAYQKQDGKKTLLAHKCRGSAAAHPFSWRRVSERGEEGRREWSGSPAGGTGKEKREKNSKKKKRLSKGRYTWN